LRKPLANKIKNGDSGLKAVPIIEDGVVPVAAYGEYLTKLEQLLQHHHVQVAVWGHAGDANLHVRPLLNLAQVGDRQKAIRLMEEYYNLVIGLGGTTSGEHGDGRLRAPFLPKLYGEEAYGLMLKVKQIFDPYSILNPGVKVNVSMDDIKLLMRQEYSLGVWYGHMPRS